jgi:uncharacterized protein
MNRRDFLQATGLTTLALAALSEQPAQPAAAAPDPGVYPYKFREIEHTWIPMPDGVRLASRIWLPEGAEKHPVPAIFNYCPYYARMHTRPGDDLRFPYYAGHGYACVRVDIRGSGDSEGLPQDEYVEQEQLDGLEIIEWIASQPWCSGKVGMEGISWSGFNSLQVAARRPPALKAILTHCFTDDRYADDAHYKGGCVISDMFDWGTVWMAIQGQPSDPAITGEDGWRERWMARLNAVEFNIGTWMSHPHKDAFWKHASVNEDYSDVQCAVYAVGGWVDGYKNPVGRTLAGLRVPRKGLIGPWTHIYPHEGVPGPAIGYLQEALRWWDHWLKDKNTGIMDEPMLRVWMEQRPPIPGEVSVPGRWVAEDTWPSPRIGEKVLYLNGYDRLGATPGEARQVTLEPVQTVGLASGNWCPSGAGAADDLVTEIAQDQRLDDARSMVFDSEPVTEAFEILGGPVVELDLSVDKPVAYVVARLNTVQPSGQCGRVSYGILNLCQRDSNEHPQALVPGQRYRIRLRLDDCASSFAAGTRIRLSLSTAYWPLMLPSPEPVTLTVYTGASLLRLPVRPPRAEDAKLHPFEPPYVPPGTVESVWSKPGSHVIEWNMPEHKRTVHHDVGASATLLQALNTVLSGAARMRFEIRDDDPNSLVSTYEYTIGMERADWRPKVVATTRVETTQRSYVLTGEMVAYYGDTKVFARVYDREIPRDLV